MAPGWNSWRAPAQAEVPPGSFLELLMPLSPLCYLVTNLNESFSAYEDDAKWS